VSNEAALGGSVPVERIYERDVDLLLAEEFDVNPAFRTI